ncbi:MAG TPA: C4-dicarboxylate ABC transporter, partial [Burkholderiaceae bacterium]|nr:C4-dicarboxylate ABC transporter [Burkholderiaceae bacterium]
MTTTPAEGRMTAELERLVADADTGGRKLSGPAGKFVALVAIAWSVFQFWYASPLPFTLNFGILNDTEVRALHLGIALFLAYLAYPMFKSSPRTKIPVTDWV